MSRVELVCAVANCGDRATSKLCRFRSNKLIDILYYCPQHTNTVLPLVQGTNPTMVEAAAATSRVLEPLEIDCLLFLNDSAQAWARFRRVAGNGSLSIDIGLVDGSILYYLITRELPPLMPHDLLNKVAALSGVKIISATVDDYDQQKRRFVCHFDVEFNGRIHSIECRSADVYSLAIANGAQFLAGSHLISVEA